MFNTGGTDPSIWVRVVILNMDQLGEKLDKK